MNTTGFIRKRLLIIILCSIIAPSGFAQTAPSKLLTDFDLYRQILEKAHAGLYKYHSKQQIDSIFTHYRAKISTDTGLESFYQYLSAILSHVGSLHDDVSLPQDYLDSMVKDVAFFPYPVKMIDGKLLVNVDAQTIPAGAEILSVNGEPISSILPRLYKYYTTDGKNITGKLLGIGNSFSLFYRYEYGPVSQFHIVYKSFQATQTDTLTLPAVLYKEYASLRKQRHSLYLDTLRDDRYDFQVVDSGRTAILTVNTFGLGGPTSKKHAAYKAFLHQCFTTLKEQKIPNLIVDIRKNGGGSDPNDLLTFSYLARHPFKENKEAFTIFQKVPYKQYFSTEDSSDIPDIEENFREEHNQLKYGRYYQNPSFNRVWKPNALAFKGQLYLLISPAVASAASLFASMVKSEGYATVIGEESMGGYYGHTGHNKVYYQLPNTHIDLSFSVVDLLQYVKPKKQISFGDGIIPDRIRCQSQKDFIDNRDEVMEYARRLPRLLVSLKELYKK